MEEEKEEDFWSRRGGGAAAAAAAAAAGKGEAGETATWKPQSARDPARQAPFQLHGQSVETADVPSVRHLLLPPVSSSEGKGAPGTGCRRRGRWGARGSVREGRAGRALRRRVDGGLLTIALAWARPGAGRRLRLAVCGIGLQKGTGGGGGWERLDRKEPSAPSCLGGGEGRGPGGAPSLALAAWPRMPGAAAESAGSAALRPLLLGLAH